MYGDRLEIWDLCCYDIYQLNTKYVCKSHRTGRSGWPEQCYPPGLLRVQPSFRFGFAFVKLLPPWTRAIQPFLKHVYQQGHIRKHPTNSCSSVSFDFHWQKTWQVVLFPEAESPKLLVSSALL